MSDELEFLGTGGNLRQNHRLFNELLSLVSESPSEFIDVLERALDGIWFWDIEEGNDEWMSPKFWTTFGFDPTGKKHLASEWQDLIFEEDLDSAKINIQKHLEAPLDPTCRYDQIVRYKHVDGSTRHVRCTGQAILDKQGKPYRVLGLHTDLTEKFKAEQLKVSAEELNRLRGLSEFLPQLTWTTNKEGICDYVSKNWSDYTGVPQDKLVGAQWFEYVHPEDQQPLTEQWQESVRTGQPFNVNFRIKSLGGQFRMFNARALALKDDSGKVMAWFGSNTDVQDTIEYQTRLEQEVAHKTEELEVALAQAQNQKQHAEFLEHKAKSASEAKSRFLSSISHELRTPLNGISGLAYTLQHTSDPVRSKTLLFQLSKATQHLNSLVTDVLEMSRIEEGRVQLNIRPNSIREVCESSIAIVSESALHKGIEVRFELDDALPEAALFDDVRVKQILVNLLNNAVKFTESGFIRLSSKLQGMQDSEFQIVFEVADTGIGIEKDRLVNIFEMFEQADSDIFCKYGGSGLGLGLVKGLAGLMDGQCGVESEIGKGSNFWVTLPLKSCSLDNTRSDGDSPVMKDWSGRHVLIVDDGEVNLMVLENILELTGAKISKARDGLAAIDCLKKNKDIDLVLMDIHMPKMDGLKATIEIRKMNTPTRDVKIVAITGAAMEEDRRNALAAGFDEVMFKPINPKKLLEL